MTPSNPIRLGRTLAVSSLLSSVLFALLLFPLFRFFQRINAHWLFIPWKIYFPMYWALLFSLLALSVIGCVILIRKTWGSTPSKLRDAAYNSLIILATGTMAWYLSATSFGHDPRLRQRYDTLTRLRETQRVIDDFRKTHDGQWPGDYVALLAYGMPDAYLNYYGNHKPEMNTHDASIAEIETYSDFAYFARDLTDSPSLNEEASRIIVFMGKTDLPEIPYVITYCWGNGYEYEYPYAARPASFADGQVRCILPQDLAQTLAAHNAARAKLGLPGQRINP